MAEGTRELGEIFERRKLSTTGNLYIVLDRVYRKL